MSNKTFFRQVGGSHYKKYKIQPSRFINENKIRKWYSKRQSYQINH